MSSLPTSNIELLERWAQGVESREYPAGHHPRRVGFLSGLISIELGLSREKSELLTHAAKLHDVGKVFVPDYILLKSGKLTAEEFDVLQQHTTFGARLLSGSELPVLQLAEQIAFSHHESWDGAGYPRALRGEETPLPGRIVALADVFDALTHNRPFRKAFSTDVAIELIKADRESLFDPDVVDAFLTIIERDEVATILEESEPTTSPVIEKFLDSSVPPT